MEFHRRQGVATRIVFPIQKNDGTFISEATGLDSEYAKVGTAGGSAPSFADCAAEATEIGSTGLYYLDLSASEMDDAYGVAVQIKSSSTGAIVQVILIRTQLAQELEYVHAHASDIEEFVDTEVAAILADTNELQTDLVNGGRLDLLIDAIKAKTDNLPASPAATGAAMTLTSGERSSIATAVWAAGTRTLSSFGSLAADVWAVATRTLTAFAFTPTPSNASDVTAIKAKTDNLPSDPADQSLLMAAIGDIEGGTGGATLEQIEGSTVLAKASDIAALNDLSSAETQAAAAAALAAYDPPTKSELDAALGSVSIDLEDVQSGCASALADYDPPTRAEATADKEAVIAAIGTGGGGSGAGSGAIAWNYTLTEPGGSPPIADADVWVSTDALGANVVAAGRTNIFGVVTFYLDAGTVYVWAQKAGWTFTNPDTEVVS